jgi:hypothetical protein
LKHKEQKREKRREEEEEEISSFPSSPFLSSSLFFTVGVEIPQSSYNE